jgi:hypothetical protein
VWAGHVPHNRVVHILCGLRPPLARPVALSVGVPGVSLGADTVQVKWAGWSHASRVGWPRSTWLGWSASVSTPSPPPGWAPVVSLRSVRLCMTWWVEWCGRVMGPKDLLFPRVTLSEPSIRAPCCSWVRLEGGSMYMLALVLLTCQEVGFLARLVAGFIAMMVLVFMAMLVVGFMAMLVAEFGPVAMLEALFMFLLVLGCVVRLVAGFMAMLNLVAMSQVLRWVLLKVTASRLLLVDVFSLGIPLLAVHSGPPYEAISMLIPMVVWMVLMAWMCPWASLRLLLSSLPVVDTFLLSILLELLTPRSA